MTNEEAAMNRILLEKLHSLRETGEDPEEIRRRNPMVNNIF